jgi:4-aminobutyrate aminotransferase
MLVKIIMRSKKEVIDMDRDYYQQGYARVPIVITEGKGCSIKDLDGNEYIDCFAGIATSNAGHSPDRLVRAGIEQMKKFLHCSGRFYNIPQTFLAKKLAEITHEGLVKTFLCNSGTEAVENAVKIAKKYAYSRGKTGSGFISLECSFHGRLAYALTLTGNARYKKGFGTYANAPGVVHAPSPYCYRSKLDEDECGYETAMRVKELIDRQTTGDVAAMIVEPILGEGGIIVPPDSYFIELTKILREAEIPFIADEVQTGFGRTGKFFACEHWDLKPEIMTMAKGLGAGMPIGAVISTDKIADCIESGDLFSTYGGNPVCSAIALENIAMLLDEDLIKNSEKTGKYIMTRLKELQEKYEIMGDVRGKGLMIGVELVQDTTTKVPAVKETKILVEAMLKAGVIIGLGGIFKNVIRVQPPLCLSEEEANQVLRIIDTEIRKL